MRSIETDMIPRDPSFLLDVSSRPGKEFMLSLAFLTRLRKVESTSSNYLMLQEQCWAL